MKNLIVKGTVLPVTYRERCWTPNYHSGDFSVDIYSNESDQDMPLGMCDYLGNAQFAFPQKLDSEMPVDFLFTLTEEGKLRLRAHDSTYNQTVEAEFIVEGVLTGDG